MWSPWDTCWESVLLWPLMWPDVLSQENYSTIVCTKELHSSLMVVSDSSDSSDSSEAVVTLLLSNQIVAFLNKNSSSVEYIHLSDLYTGAARDRRTLVFDGFLCGDNGEGDFPNEGYVVKDSDNCFTVWCIGRTGCDWMMAQLRMLTLQLAADDMDNIVLALGQKKAILKQSKDLEDLVCGDDTESVPDKVPQKWLQFSYLVTSAQDPQSFVQFALFLLDHVKFITLSREWLCGSPILLTKLCGSLILLTQLCGSLILLT
eukprot:Em0362g1a